ncbi:AraC family transcriptional regulator [Pseudomonas syringae pv. actinidiae ICMP 19073]|uniref:AraC family transcriptional regulator n=1 Tax=Pseudomonas syringae TaxID=317 RepID=UPI000356E83D|nr:AraC family transcriptional regulator [Pseudomonas syringae]EPM56937.1 AraC family transcriptional regulator [Pseudomonas syringae pv. actinidiae ICMP 19073]
MTLKSDWYEADSRFIPGHYQPATLIDLALSRGIDSHRLLKGTGLFYEDIVAGKTRLSPQQCFALIANAQRQMDADDTSFLFGQRLFPGHYGAASHALRHAQNLHQALEILLRQQALLSPLLTPRLELDEHFAYLYWLDSCGAGEQQRFLLEASMTALVAMSQLLGNARLPWPGASPIAVQVAQQEAAGQLAALGMQASLLDRLHQHLRDNVREAASLEQVAQAFAMSPATLKRKLHKHGTSFQAQHDLARKHVALYLYQIKGMSNEAVADYLNFNDPANFRRSFKRWTGSTPTLIQRLFNFD